MKNRKSTRPPDRNARKLCTVLSVFLSLVLLLQIPAGAVTVSEESAVTPAAAVTASEAATIVSENTELRNEFEKHFVMSDGTGMAVSYADPVHEKLDNGSWQEIDNTLTLQNGRYENGAEMFKASFAANTSASSGQLVSVESQGYDLSWSLTVLKSNPNHELMSVGNTATAMSVFSNPTLTVAPSLSAAAVENSATAFADAVTDEQRIGSAVSSSKLTYSGAFGSGTAVEYAVRPYGVKENIILQNADTGFRGYVMHIAADGLTPQVNDQSGIDLIDAEGEVIFTVQAPYMIDAEHNISDDIQVTFISTADGYDITYTPSASWLATAVYPVIVDPTVNSSQAASNLLDTYTYDGDSSSNATTRQNAIYMYVGNKSVSGTRKKHIGYFKFINLPTIPSGYAFQSANVVLQLPSGTSTSEPFDLHRITEDWVTTGLCWTDKPSYDSTPLYTAANRNTSTNVVPFAGTGTNRNVSNTVGHWYSGYQNNYGFMVCYTSASNSVADFNSFYTSNYSTTASRPYMIVYYELLTNYLSSGVYYIRNVDTGQYWTAYGNAPNQGVVATSAYANQSNKKWQVTRQADGYYRITSLANSATTLGVEGSYIGQGAYLQMYSGDSGYAMDMRINADLDSNGYPISGKYRVSTRISGCTNYVTNSTSNIYQCGYLSDDTQVWEFAPVPTGFTLPESATMNYGETLTVNVTPEPYNATIPTLYWSSGNIAVATVDQSGVVTARKPGTVTITAKDIYSGVTDTCTISIFTGVPAIDDLLVEGLISSSDIQYTDDGFYLVTKSVGDILSSCNISFLIDEDNDPQYSNRLFDDWYIYAVPAGNSYVYGLLKMREQENDPEEGYDNDNPGVTVSFIEFEIQDLLNCCSSATNENRLTLFETITKVTGPEIYEHNTHIVSYFAETSSKAPYLIAETYIEFIVSTNENGAIIVPELYLELLDTIQAINESLENPYLDSQVAAQYILQKQKLERIPNWVLQNNTNAGHSIYDITNNVIYVDDINNLSIFEKYVILSVYTADANFNSFAAEVEFHADAVNSWQADIPMLGNVWYSAAVRADMAIGEDAESGFYDEYYDLEGDLVLAQATIHGNY